MFVSGPQTQLDMSSTPPTIGIELEIDATVCEYNQINRVFIFIKQSADQVASIPATLLFELDIIIHCILYVYYITYIAIYSQIRFLLKW